MEYSSLRWDVQERDGVIIINDAYNANPLSMEASITAAREMRGKRLIPGPGGNAGVG